MKLSDKFSQWHAAFPGRPHFSLEIFPPKTAEAVAELVARLDRLAAVNPMWLSVTWGAGGSTRETTLLLCTKALEAGMDVMMHVTGLGATKQQMMDILTEAKARGVRNIQVLRGDVPKWADDAFPREFPRAIDLVRFIRNNFGDYFCMAVTGYPEKHPEAPTLEADIERLKEKLDAGGDFVVTQFFCDIDTLETYVKKCRAIGITAPIIPGIMPIMNYENFVKFTSICGTRVPAWIRDGLEAVSQDEEKVLRFGVQVGTKLGRSAVAATGQVGPPSAPSARQDMPSGICPGIHICTLNSESSAISIVKNLMMVPLYKSIAQTPWMPAAVCAPPSRAGEVCRPVHWNLRARSYVDRTSHWTKFPTADEWDQDCKGAATGAATGAAMGAAATGTYSAVGLAGTTPTALSVPKDVDGRVRRAIWGRQINQLEDVARVFYSYLRDATRAALPAARASFTSVTALPWRPAPVEPAGWELVPELLALAAMGVCPIQWLRALNGEAAESRTHGWVLAPGLENCPFGEPARQSGGLIYQKQYVEFFVHPKVWTELKVELEKVTAFGFLAASHAEPVPVGNVKKPTTLTWGVFPNSPVVQPLIFSPTSFRAWAEEAFMLWETEWASIYEAPEPEPEAKAAAAAKAADTDKLEAAKTETEAVRRSWSGLSPTSAEFIRSVGRSWVLVCAVDNDFVRPTLIRQLAQMAESIVLKTHVYDPYKIVEAPLA